MITLRDYQYMALAGVRDSYRAGNRRVLLVSPTGSGKTVTFSYLAGKYLAVGKRVLMQAHRIELVNQISDTLTGFGIPHGTITAGKAMDSNPIQVAMKDTLASRVKYDTAKIYGNFDLVITDESHHLAPGSQWDLVCQHNNNARHLGVTATPCRLDGAPLGRESGGFFDSMVLGPSVKDLINHPDGPFLTPPLYLRPEAEKIPKMPAKGKGADLTKDQQNEFMDSLGSAVYGDSITEYRKYCDGAPALGYCVSIEKAHEAANEFKLAGYQAATITGKTPDAERSEIVRDFKAGLINIITSVGTLTEGTDLPNAIAAFIWRPTASLSLSRQIDGRVLRVWPGKDLAYIFDQVGNSYKHGFCTDDIEWSLNVKPKFKAERAQKSEWQCEECYEIVPIALDKCQNCGNVKPNPESNERELEKVAAPLSIVDPLAESLSKHYELIDRETVRKGKKISDMELDELKEYGRKMGYKPGWAYVQMKLRNKRRAA